NKKFVFFIQEYEAIFHRHDAYGFVVASTYDNPHFAIFNSENLKNYFSQKTLGVFKAKIRNTDESNQMTKSSDFFVFEHVLPKAKLPDPESLRLKKKKKLIFYSRPEDHAERNLFEIGMIAIKRAIAKGHFRGWDIHGIGALSGGSLVDLGCGQNLILFEK